MAIFNDTAWYGRMETHRQQEAIQVDRRAREARETAERQRTEARQIEADEAEAMRLMQSPATEAEGWRQFGGVLARRHRLMVVESARLVRLGVGGLAHQGLRRITVPPHWWETPIGRATFVHEAGHIVSGACPEREPHRPNPTVREWHACLECERSAWEAALRLAPFTRAMFDDLKAALGSYRRNTPAAPTVLEASRRLASDQVWAQRVQERAKREQQLADIERIAADARRRVPPRWEKQWKEMSKIAGVR